MSMYNANEQEFLICMVPFDPMFTDGILRSFNEHLPQLVCGGTPTTTALVHHRTYKHNI